MQSPPTDSFSHWLLFIIGVLILAAAGGWIKWWFERKKQQADIDVSQATAGKLGAEGRQLDSTTFRDLRRDLREADEQIDKLFDERRGLRDSVVEMQGNLKKRLDDVEVELKQIRAVVELQAYMDEKKDE
jgi:uncharacterized protein YdcH (DUF465 family)